MAEDRIACRTPTEGRDGVTRIPTWKFEAVRRAILEDLSNGPQPFKGLPARVGARLTEDERARLGSLGWHVTCVKLEMEVRGEISRIAGSSPQMLRLESDDD